MTRGSKGPETKPIQRIKLHAVQPPPVKGIKLRRKGPFESTYIPNISALFDAYLKWDMDSTTPWPVNDDPPPRYFSPCRAAGRKGARRKGFRELRGLMFIVGYLLAINTDQERPPNVANNVWRAALKSLESAFLDNGQDWTDLEFIWIWYLKTFPKFVQLVPVKFKRDFLEGIAYAYDEGEMDKFLSPPSAAPAAGGKSVGSTR